MSCMINAVIQRGLHGALHVVCSWPAARCANALYHAANMHRAEMPSRGCQQVLCVFLQVDRAGVALDQRPGMRALAVLYLAVLHLLAVL